MEDTSVQSALDAKTTILSSSAVETAPIEAAPIEAAPITENASPVEAIPTRESVLDTDTTILSPSAIAATAPMAAASILEMAVEMAPPVEAGFITDDAAPTGATDEPEKPEEPGEEQLETEPRQEIPTRKLPTLAVMAALAVQAEARAESSALEDIRAREALDQPEAEETPVTALDAALEDAQDAQDAQDTNETALPTGALALGELGEEELSARHPILSEPPVSPSSVTRPGPRGQRPTTQPLASAAAPDHSDDPSTSGNRRMWWLNTPNPTEADREADRAEPDALNGLNEWDARPTALPWSAPRSAPRARPATQPPAPRRAPAITRPLDRWPETMRDTSRLRRARISGGRAGALEAEPATPLVWVGGAQAALCGTAALVAVIALLNGTAGARAVSVFTWAIIFALIAGTGAGLGHLAWRMKRARLATLTLLLSQLGLLAWMLGLLGARPAMMLLVPFGMALALRGMGRAAAVITGLAALALYALTFALGLAGVFAPAITLPASVAATLDIVFVGIGLALTAMMLASLYAAGERERARTRAIERAARLSAIELDALRMRMEDDAETLRRALSAALRGAPTEAVRAEGALSPLAEQVSAVAERLVDLSYDREERKRLESATRRLIRNIERAWLGLSWSWPEASGVILDDLVALLRTPPPSEPTQLPEDTTPTGQVVAPHLYRAWQPGVSIPSQPLAPQLGLWPSHSSPSQPSGVWPDTAERPGICSTWRGPHGASPGPTLARPR